MQPLYLEQVFPPVPHLPVRRLRCSSDRALRAPPALSPVSPTIGPFATGMFPPGPISGVADGVRIMCACILFGQSLMVPTLHSFPASIEGCLTSVILAFTEASGMRSLVC